jgi:hypothetical protein
LTFVVHTFSKNILTIKMPMMYGHLNSFF